MWALLAIPLKGRDRWETEKFRRIPANEVTFSATGAKIKVKASASPLIFPLATEKELTGFHIRGEFNGLPKFSEVGRQGEKGADDYALRVGFVISGEKRLTGLKKMFAPAWIVNLYSKVPKGSGVDHIEFFNLTQNPAQVGQSRMHPLSDLIRENFFALVQATGPFVYDFTFRKPLKTAALWLSIDGDDTKSVYEVVLGKLELDVAE